MYLNTKKNKLSDSKLQNYIAKLLFVESSWKVLKKTNSIYICLSE